MRPGLRMPTGSKATAGTNDCHSSRRLSRKPWCAISIIGAVFLMHLPWDGLAASRSSAALRSLASNRALFFALLMPFGLELIGSATRHVVGKVTAPPSALMPKPAIWRRGQEGHHRPCQSREGRRLLAGTYSAATSASRACPRVLLEALSGWRPFVPCACLARPSK